MLDSSLAQMKAVVAFIWVVFLVFCLGAVSEGQKRNWGGGISGMEIVRGSSSG